MSCFGAVEASTLAEWRRHGVYEFERHEFDLKIMMVPYGDGPDAFPLRKNDFECSVV